MGPCSSEHGKADGPAADALDPPASMGPCSSEHGKERERERKEGEHERFNGAVLF